MKINKYILPIIIALLFATTVCAQSLWFPNNSDNLEPVDDEWGITIPELISCDTIDTDANGDFVCGIDAGTAYSGGTNLTLDGTTFNVDDAFVSNTGDSIGGDFLPATTSIYDLGNGSYIWKDLYATTFYGDGSYLTNVGVGVATALTISAKVNEGAGITKGQAVYFSGATGQRPQVSLADNTVEEKTRVLGIAVETKTDGQTILVRTAGEVTSLDTSAWADGDDIFLSTAGGFTTTTPTTGTIILCGAVTYSNANTGILQINIRRIRDRGTPSGIDIFTRLGDNDGANKLAFRDYANNEIGHINSDGGAYFAGSVGIGTTTPAREFHSLKGAIFGQSTLEGANNGMVNVELHQDDDYVQALKMYADRDGLAVLYGFNGTAIGANTKNVGLYGWAGGGTTNLGLWIDSGDVLLDEDITVSGNSILAGDLTLNTDWTGLLRADSGVVSTTTAGAGDLLADGSVPLTADWDAGNSLYDITAVEFKGALIGNASTATTLAANGANATSGYAIIGVDASGAFEGAFDVWTEAENTNAGYISATLTQEQVEDYAGGMWTGNTETLITITYEEGDNTLDAVVTDDLSLYDNTTSTFITGLAYSELTGYPADVITAGTGIDWSASTTLNFNSSGLTWAGNALTNAYIASSTEFLVDTNTDVYWTGVSTNLVAATGRTSLELGTMSLLANTGSSTINYLGTIGNGVWEGTAIDDTYIASSTEYLADTNTQLSQAQVEDFAGGLWTGNTETLIALDYQEGDNTMDAVIDSDLHKYSWTNVVDADITNTLTASIVSDADKGDVVISSGSWTLDTGTVADNEIDYTNVTLADFDYQTAWRMFYSDAAGDVTELALGATSTVLTSAGLASAPTWEAAGGGDVTDVFDCSTGDCNTMTVGTDEWLIYGTGFIDANRFAGVTTVDGTEFGYLNDVSSAIQTQLNAKAPADSPTFTTAFTATGLIGDEDLQSEDFGEFTCAGEDACTIDDGVAVTNWNLTTPTITTSIDLPANAINTATEISADIITHTQILDSDQADTKCLWFEDPTADDDFKSIWSNKTANDFLITEIWAESDQTVSFDLQVDDGTPADVNGTDIAPAAGEAEDTSLEGDTTVAAGEELDLIITSVTNTPTWVSICFTGNWVD